MTFPDCQCCAEKKGTIRVPFIGHVCPECMVLLGKVERHLHNPALRLSECAEPVRPRGYADGGLNPL